MAWEGRNDATHQFYRRGLVMPRLLSPSTNHVYLEISFSITIIYINTLSKEIVALGMLGGSWKITWTAWDVASNEVIDIISNMAEMRFKFNQSKTYCVHFFKLWCPHDEPLLFLNNSRIWYKLLVKLLGLFLDRQSNHIGTCI